MDKFSPYATDKELDRRFHDITTDYDKSPPPTATTSPVYPSLNGMLFDSSIGGGVGGSMQSDLNGNTKPLPLSSSGMNIVGSQMNLSTPSSQTDALSNLNRTATSLNGTGGLLSNITGSHNSAGNIQMDRKFLQFTTDQVRMLENSLLPLIIAISD